MPFTPATLITDPTYEKIKFDGTLASTFEVITKLDPLIGPKLFWSKTHGFDAGDGTRQYYIEIQRNDGTPESRLDPGVWCVISSTGIVRFLMDNEYLSEFQPDQPPEGEG